MTLSSASSLINVRNAYLDNASYEQNNDVNACATFVTACRMLLAMMPTVVSAGGDASLTIDLKIVQQELTSARQWLDTNSSNNSGAGIVAVDLQNFRGGGW